MTSEDRKYPKPSVSRARARSVVGNEQKWHVKNYKRYRIPRRRAFVRVSALNGLVFFGKPTKTYLKIPIGDTRERRTHAVSTYRCDTHTRRARRYEMISSRLVNVGKRKRKKERKKERIKHRDGISPLTSGHF